MNIQVLGSGCATCKKLFDRTEVAVQELGIEAKVEYITDVQKIVDMGLMQSPVMAVNGKPVVVGYLPEQEKLKELLSEATK